MDAQADLSLRWAHMPFAGFVVRWLIWTLSIFLTLYLNSGQDYWIGLTDEIIEGIWMWSSSGAQANYTDWGPGEPNSNHGNQDCAFYHSGEQYMWADIACSSTDFRPLCEKRWVLSVHKGTKPTLTRSTKILPYAISKQYRSRSACAFM